MGGYNFTERVRKVLALAREEAGRLRHEYVGTEHILLGLVREGEGVAAAVLRNLHVDPDKIRESVEGQVKKGINAITRADLPYTTRAKKVLELAMSEANDLGHEYVGTEHLLLGLLREERGVAAQTLTSLGVDLAAVRAETLTLLGQRIPGHDRPARSTARPSLRPVRVTIQVEYEDSSRSENTFERAADAIRFIGNLAWPAS